ncbi:MAG: dihydroneopterin aldolase [Candidatus Dormibacteraeota bacterium]|nr:dihydroneopterin aldolase [Candidatus Dormibacteraeota bacterium]
MASDRLLLEGLQFFGHHGDVEAERALGGRVDVDVEIRSDLSTAGRSDQLQDTVDYVRCYEAVRQVVENKQHNLLEKVAEEIASALLSDERIASVRVRVAKQPPLAGIFHRFAVVIERERSQAQS